MTKEIVNLSSIINIELDPDSKINTELNLTSELELENES